MNASLSARVALPGHSYYGKLTDFINSHFDNDKPYFESRLCCKSGELCDLCEANPWIGNIIERVSRPVPGENGKYLSFEETPTGSSRSPDD